MFQRIGGIMDFFHRSGYFPSMEVVNEACNKKYYNMLGLASTFTYLLTSRFMARILSEINVAIG